MLTSLLKPDIPENGMIWTAPDRACDKTSDRLFSKLVLERAPSNDECSFQKSSLDGALSKRGVENKRSEVLYQARSGAAYTVETDYT